MKIGIVLTVLLLTASLPAASSLMQQRAKQDQLTRSRETKKTMALEALKWKITQTLDLLEPMAQRLASASKEDAEEVWASGKRDFKLKGGVIHDVRNAVLDLFACFDAQAQARQVEAQLERTERETAEYRKLRGKLEDLHGRAADLHDKARSDLKEIHKTGSEALLRDLRNWISVSEGELRTAAEKAPKATPTP